MDKMKVLELATAAHLESLAGLHLWHPDITAGQVQDFCDKFAELIEREVRGEINPALNEWLDKTEWVQKRRDWPFPELGMHRADVMRRYIEHLEAKSSWDAQPVGYTNEGYKGMQYANAEAYKGIRPDFIERNKLTAPLFAHPATAVVRQLVGAVERLREKAKWINDEQAIVGYGELMEVKEALAAAKEAVL